MQQKHIVIAISLVLASAAAHAQVGFAAVQVSPGTGTQAWASGDYSVAIGQNTIGGTTRNGFQALAITPPWAYEMQTAVGSGSIAWGNQDSAYGTGSVAASMPVGGVSGAATSIGSGSAAWGANNTAVGYRALAGASSPGGPLSNPTIANATALGGGASVQESGGTAVGANATVTMGATNSVALGYGSMATRANTVEVGGRIISGVANPVQGTDAVNLQTLQASLAGLGGGGVDPTSIINQAVGQANAYTDQAINSLRREYSRAIAAVAASPALPALAPGERAIALGGGTYNGQQSLGIAYGQALSGGAMVNAGVSTAGSGKAVARAGVAWKF